MNIVITLKKSQIQEVINMLRSEQLVQIENSHGLSFRTDGVVISVYNSGKIMLQGKESKAWEKILRNSFDFSQADIGKGNDLSFLESEKKDVLFNLPFPRIGSDESGKGDFFGPLITVAFLIPSKEVENTLENLGVIDSKKLSDKKIMELAPKIKQLGLYQVVKIGPAKYNELYSRMNNINKILGWSHARAIENILIVDKNCSLAVADQFGDESIIQKTLFEKGQKISLIQTHKAERDTAVAAASIIARATFIESIQLFEDKIRYQLPLGASEQVISVGAEIARKKGTDFLKEIAKIHFKTYEIIKNRL